MENSELFTRRNLIALIILAVLLLVIPLGVNLVRQQQILRSRASVDGIVEFKKGDGTAITETENSLPLVHERNIQVVLQDPRGPTPTTKETGYLYQSLISVDGMKGWVRQCPVDTNHNGGINFEACGTFNEVPGFANAVSGNSGFSSLSERYFTARGQEFLYQSLISKDGMKGWVRQCPVDKTHHGGINFEACGTFNEVPGFANVVPGNSGFSSLSERYFTARGQRFLYQSLISKDGMKGWVRQCPVDTDHNGGVNFEACTPFNEVPGFANAVPGNSGFAGLSERYFTAYGKEYLYQSLISKNGLKAWVRQCAVDTDRNGGINFDDCTPFNEVPGFAGVIAGNNGFIALSERYFTVLEPTNAQQSFWPFQLVRQAQAATEPCSGQVFSCSDIKCADGGTAPGTGCYPNQYASDCQANCAAAGRNSTAPVSPAASASPAAPTGGGTTDSHGCNTATQTWSYCDYSCPGTGLKVTGGFCYGRGTNPDGACVATGDCAAAAAAPREECRAVIYSCTTADGQPGKNTCNVCRNPGTPPPGVTYGDTIRACGTCVLATTAGNPPAPGQSSSPTNSTSPAASPTTSGTVTLRYVILADTDNAAALNDDSRKIAWNATSGRFTQAYQLSSDRAGQRTVFAKFIYSDGSSSQSHKDIVYRPVVGDPTISGITCVINPSNPPGGTLITITGTNLSTTTGANSGTYTINGQPHTFQGGAATPTNVSANFTNTFTGTLNITYTRSDNKTITGVCTIGQSQLQFTAQLSCKTVNQPPATATVELLDASNGTSLYKNEQVTFSTDGTAQNVLPPTPLTAGARYVLTIKSPFTLTRAIEFRGSGQNTTVLAENPLKLPLGDVAPEGTPDGAINNVDQAYVRSKWSPTADVTTSADTNIDRRVNSNDWACVRSNFGKTNDQVVR